VDFVIPKRRKSWVGESGQLIAKSNIHAKKV